MKKQAGFTLIELVMVIVILGILAASFAPKFFDLSGAATSAAQLGALGAIKGGIPVAAAELRRTPTLAELAARVDGVTAEADGTGLNLFIDGIGYEAATFTDSACTVATAATTDPVNCVGDTLAAAD